MKKTSLVILASLLIVFISCKNEVKKQKEEKVKIEIKETYKVNPEKTTVKWTAYKTTDKTPVSGTFKSIKIESKETKNPIDAFNGLVFSIPVNSLFSDNEERDGKLVASFFGSMIDTDLISGTLSFNEEKMCTASINLNGVSHDVPLSYTAEENTFTFNGTMNLENWNALNALEALNKVCLDLHKGADGISKTWNDVAIEITTVLTKK